MELWTSRARLVVEGEGARLLQRLGWCSTGGTWGMPYPGRWGLWSEEGRGNCGDRVTPGGRFCAQSRWGGGRKGTRTSPGK